MKPQDAAPRPRTVVQIVRVRWDKSARGGEAAALRNSVPLALPFEARGFDEAAPMWIEQWDCSGPDFTASRRLQRPGKNGDFHIDGLVVRHLADVTSIAGTLRCGAPERHASLRYELRDGQWMRGRWNGRFSNPYEGFWWYEAISLNIARVSGQAPRDVFLARLPDHDFESLARLW